MPRQGGQGKGKPKKHDKDFGVALIKKHFQGNMGFNGIAAQGGRNKNMSSILDNSHLDDFVATTEMSGADVEVHRVHQNHAFLVEATVRNSVQHISTQQYDYRHLKIPRKPSWNRQMTADEVHRREKDSFLSWRRDIANLENENNGKLRVTPFEKNIEVWRQLWRVLEKSDMAIQIVDARNPLLYYTTDLMTYASEHSPPRPMMLLINKADYLTEYQRIAWAKHFDTIGIEFIFYSAQIEQDKIDMEQSLLKAENIETNALDLEDVEDNDDDDEKVEGGNIYKNIDLEDIENLVENMLVGSLLNPDLIVDNSVSAGLNKVSIREPECEMVWGDSSVNNKEDAPDVHHSSGLTGDITKGNVQSIEQRERDTLRAKILTREELTLFLQLLPQGLNLKKQDKNKGRFCVGMLGYPNVGKSSVINTLLGVSKSIHGVLRVGVSSTPGKTKHFQTLMLNDSIMLCDCPGLVFPSFMRSTGEMICSGILPINQMKEYEEPGEVIASRVPQHLLEAAYGMKIKRDLDFTDNPERPPTSHEMLCSYAALKGLITNGTGRWDEFRACKEMIRDFNDGRILFNAPPSNIGDMKRWLMETEKVMLRREKVADRLAVIRLKEMEQAQREEEEEQRKMIKKKEKSNNKVIDVHLGDDMIFGDSKVVHSDSVVDGIKFDDDSDSNSDNSNSSESEEENTKREHKKIKKWGKKNRKLREKTPYAEENGTISYAAFTMNRANCSAPTEKRGKLGKEFARHEFAFAKKI